MKISVLGLGYVGAVSAGCLARDGHEVIGVDPERVKVDLINAGRSPIIEKDIGGIIAEQAAAGRLRASTDLESAVRHTDLALVCVGTPSLPNGGLDLRYVRRVCEQIGRVLATHPRRAGDRDALDHAAGNDARRRHPDRSSATRGKRAGEEFGVCINPEFLREGTAVHDYYHPPKTVIGEMNRASGDLLANLYGKMPGPLIRTDIETAEMVKYADNCLARAQGRLRQRDRQPVQGAAGRRAQGDGDLLPGPEAQPVALLPQARLRLRRLLPAEGRARAAAQGEDARRHAADPRLRSCPPTSCRSSAASPRWWSKGRRKVGILGFSFKAGTDDLRESPMVELCERLIGKGYDLRVYDRNVSLAALHGANRDYILNRIPHISRLMVPTVDEVLAHAETMVIGNASPEFAGVPARVGEGQTVIDFVRVCDSRTVLGVYEGLCW